MNKIITKIKLIFSDITEYLVYVKHLYFALGRILELTKLIKAELKPDEAQLAKHLDQYMDILAKLQGSTEIVAKLLGVDLDTVEIQTSADLKTSLDETQKAVNWLHEYMSI